MAVPRFLFVKGIAAVFVGKAYVHVAAVPRPPAPGLGHEGGIKTVLHSDLLDQALELNREVSGAARIPHMPEIEFELARRHFRNQGRDGNVLRVRECAYIVQDGRRVLQFIQLVEPADRLLVQPGPRARPIGVIATKQAKLEFGRRDREQAPFVKPSLHGRENLTGIQKMRRLAIRFEHRQQHLCRRAGAPRNSPKRSRYRQAKTVGIRGKQSQAFVECRG